MMSRKGVPFGCYDRAPSPCDHGTEASLFVTAAGRCFFRSGDAVARSPTVAAR